MIKKIINKYKTEPEEPDDVWANTEMDELRRKECLCLNCERKNDNIPYASCPVAKSIYDICLKHDMAMAITRCGAVDEEGNLMYLPLSIHGTGTGY